MILQTREHISLMWNNRDLVCVDLDVLKWKLKCNLTASPQFLHEAIEDISRIQQLIRRGNQE
jgi:hypothetical protein